MLFFLVISCGLSRKEKQEDNIQLDWHEYQLSLVNESLLTNYDNERIRFTISVPFGGVDRIYNISKIDNHFVISEKLVFEEQKQLYSSIAYKVKKKKFLNNWTKLVHINTVLENKKKLSFSSTERQIYDDISWTLETKTDSTYTFITGKLIEEEVKEFYLQLYENQYFDKFQSIE